MAQIENRMLRLGLWILLTGIASIAAGIVSTAQAQQPSQAQGARNNRPPFLVQRPFPQPRTNRNYQQDRGIDQITCPPPARPTCGSNR